MAADRPRRMSPAATHLLKLLVLAHPAGLRSDRLPEPEQALWLVHHGLAKTEEHIGVLFVVATARGRGIGDDTPPRSA